MAEEKRGTRQNAGSYVFRLRFFYLLGIGEINVMLFCLSDIQLPEGGPGGVWEEGVVLPSLQALLLGLCSRA